MFGYCGGHSEISTCRWRSLVSRLTDQYRSPNTDYRRGIMAQAPDREKALELAMAQIEKSYGKGSVMRLGDEVRQPIAVIPTGSIALDVDETAKQISDPFQSGDAQSARFSPDGKRLLIAGQQSGVQVWDLQPQNKTAPPWLLALAEMLAGQTSRRQRGVSDHQVRSEPGAEGDRRADRKRKGRGLGCVGPMVARRSRCAEDFTVLSDRGCRTKVMLSSSGS